MTVYAAGALCWRMFLDEPHVLVVYRKRHKDLSFPKGKVEPGELLPVTAIREVHEETGLSITLGAKLGVVDYPLPNGTPKEVHYWESFVTESEATHTAAAFTPNDEVSELHWLSFAEARRKLSYAFDIAPLDELERLISADIAGSYPIILLRHGKALSRSSWGRSEATRPLTSKGTTQAKSLAKALRPWHPATLMSSTWERCLRTISPYASATGTALATREKLTERAANSHPEKTRALVQHHVNKGKSVLFCTHRPVFPVLTDAIAELLVNPEALDREAITGLDTGAFAILTVSRQDEHGQHTLVGQELFDPLDV